MVVYCMLIHSLLGGVLFLTIPGMTPPSLYIRTEEEWPCTCCQPFFWPSSQFAVIYHYRFGLLCACPMTILLLYFDSKPTFDYKQTDWFRNRPLIYSVTGIYWFGMILNRFERIVHAEIDTSFNNVDTQIQLIVNQYFCNQ